MKVLYLRGEELLANAHFYKQKGPVLNPLETGRDQLKLQETKQYGHVWEAQSQKNPRVHKIGVRNSGAGNGCANFMDTWKNAFFLQEKPCP